MGMSDLVERLNYLAIGGHPDEHRPRVGGKILQEAAAEITRLRAALAAAEARAVPEGWKLVPVEPTEEMWGGLARQIVFWLRTATDPTQLSGAELHKWLRRTGYETPDWLNKEIPNANRVPEKGTIAACIYKAMLSAAPQPPQTADAGKEQG